MEFKPLNDNFLSYELSLDKAPSVLTPRLFTQIIRARSYAISNNMTPSGGHVVNQYFIDQIDMSDPNAFTLGMLEFSEWHVAMAELA